MVSALRRLFECTAASVAVEAAVFSPLFLTFTVGITDLGTSMFVGMQVNAAAQAGAAYAVIKSSCTPTGAVAICVGISLAQSPIEGYWIRQRGQPVCRRACVSASAIRRPCAW